MSVALFISLYSNSMYCMPNMTAHNLHITITGMKYINKYHFIILLAAEDSEKSLVVSR